LHFAGALTPTLRCWGRQRRCRTRTHATREMVKAGILDSEGCGEHCYDNRKCYSGCCGVGTLILVIILSMSWDTVAPTELGLLKNTITGSVDLYNVYPAGRYFVGPAASFILFPANQKVLSYGNRSRDRQRPIAARTGASGSGDTDSGGQPLSLSVSFTYQLDAERLAMVYGTYGQKWESSYMRFAQEALTDVAQRFTPSEFWKNRRGIEIEMEKAVNRTISNVGFAQVKSLQLKSVGFQSSYETTITNIQLQEQLKVTKSFQLEVTRVLKEVDVTQAETSATVALINAEAARERAQIEGQANANALEREQSVKAILYRRMRDHLGWSSQDFLQYIKMRALNKQPTNNVVVGVSAVGNLPS